MARREAYAYIRPASEEEKDFPQVLKVEGSTVTLKESSSRTRSLAVDGVYQSDQTQLLDDLSGRLFAQLKNEGDVHMHVLGATGTGKSRCLFGKDGEEGLIERWADKFYSQRNMRGHAIIDLQIFDVSDEVIYDLLCPGRTGALRFSPTGGPWVDGLSRHLAGNKEEFSSLLKDALTVKAASLLRKDDMISHLCIRCMCSYDAEGGKDPPAHEGTTTFVELASSILESQSSDAEEVPSVLRASTALAHMSSNIRVAAAQVCSSALTYILADGFCHTSLWLGCLSPSTTDLDVNVNTLKTLERVDRLTIANDWTLEPRCEAAFYGSKSHPSEKPILARQRHLDTVAYREERDEWLRDVGVARAKQQGVQARRLQKTILLHVSSDALTSGRLFIPLKDVVYFGSSLDTIPEDCRRITLGRPEILPLHCVIQKRGDMILLDANANATVCVNGVKVTGSHAVKDGDLVLMGFGCLFRVCTSGNDTDIDWREALQGLHTDLTLSEGTPWERISEEKLVDELQQMTIVGNNIARSKERDVHYAVQLANTGPDERAPCVLVASASSEVTDLWNAGKMLRRLCKIRRSVEEPDPFFDAPDHKLIGVGFCALQSLIYLMDITETCNIISFKGKAAGTLQISVKPTLANSEQLVGEKNLAYHLGKKVELNITITQAMKLPRKLCSSVYVRTAFFLQQDGLSTPRYPTATTSPYFGTSFKVSQIITEDFLSYLETGALELQVWGRCCF